MIELVPMAYRITREVDLSPSNPSSTSNANGNGSTNGGGSVNTGRGEGGGSRVEGGEEQEQEERDAVFYRLEMLGYRVGQGLVERFVALSLSKSQVAFC